MAVSTGEISVPHARVASRRFKRALGRTLIYAALIFWSFVCLFPLYWVVTTSFKVQVDILQRRIIPYVQFEPSPKGWDSIFGQPGQRANFIKHARNTVIASVASATAATVIGSLAAYGLTRFTYKFGPWRNRDISFWFLSQLILPPVALAMPLLVLYRELDILDSRLGLILIYTIMNLPIVIWIMRDQFNSIPIELEQAALVDGATTWQAFFRIVVPVAGPGLVAAFILAMVFAWNEYFFALVLTSTKAVTLPFLIAGQTSSQGIRWWSMAALSTAAIVPLAVIGILLERFIVKGLTAGAVK